MTATDPPFEPHTRVRMTTWEPDLPEGSEGVVQGCHLNHPGTLPGDWDVIVRMDDGTVWTVDPDVLEAVATDETTR